MQWDEITEGHEAPAFVDDPLTITDFVRYQGASGDMNPIHHDTEFARRAGYAGPFAVGMLQAGVMASYVTDWLGLANIRRFKVQFREQAWPGDVISYRAVVVARRVEGHYRFVDVELSATRQTGGVHLRGWATFAVPDSI
jgi:acyl dehydratase